MMTNYMNDFYKQFEEVCEKLDKANKTIKRMKDELKEANNLNKKYLNEINKMKLEIERLKNNK